MRRARTFYRSARLAVAAFVILCLGGCVFGERYLADEPLFPEPIQGIKRGVTKRGEVIERLGPPAAVARRGTTMVFPPPGPYDSGYTEIQAEAFLELFSADRALQDAEIVYYYDSARTKASGFLFVPLIGGGYHSKRLVVDRLWLLVDERTDVIEDYVFRGED